MWTVFPANSTLNKANTLNEDLEGLLFYKYVHNENLQLIAIESEYKKTGNPYSNLNLLYDNKLLVQTNLIEFKGQSQTESKGIYTYNENYDLVSYQIDNTDKTKNTSKFTSTYIYNQIGNVIKKEKSFSVDLGSFQVETNSLTSFKYNKENQMIESIEEIDSENTLIKSTVGYRNNSKHLIETIRTQSSNGDLMLTEFEYDKFERIVKVKSSDIKLNKIALTTYIRE